MATVSTRTISSRIALERMAPQMISSSNEDIGGATGFADVRRPERGTKAAMQHETTPSNGFSSIPERKPRDTSGGGDWIIQKFGGTSLGKFAITIAEDIVLYVVAESV